MALTEYQKKRDFSRTAEPKGSTRARRKHSDRLLFTMQKHDARRLHYDLRLEHDGVLLSWAVPKGPSLDPADKRLAVRTEDHPIDYAEFEGTIPAGEYGAGTVLLWDSGSWTPEDDVAAGLKKGKLHFSLSGEKLKGRWHLQRLRSRGAGDKENWLLIKGKDDFALPENGDVVVETRMESVQTGRGLREIAETLCPATSVGWIAGGALAVIGLLSEEFGGGQSELLRGSDEGDDMAGLVVERAVPVGAGAPVLKGDHAHARTNGAIRRVTGGPEQAIVGEDHTLVDRDGHGHVRAGKCETGSLREKPGEVDTK